ncbi:perosamine synthetase [Desulfonauticus submarinus]|uniref:Perosamine synthetase n=1 Tax=Desulfonauticus submarinus TaxID=206665 RepID=A0A1H0BGB1_9BACT|nr:UDP-4-amino-4,6-dideoxy-N-acetyl-beta-L-altrosamine transaminase [Desulfonauticus submarinus]SDN44658.1 perosamine synthetase [Desulfonauticus submarinus]
MDYKDYIPYGCQSIDEDDIASVCSVLRSDWLTTGPKVAQFEQAIANYVGARYAVAVSSGTAALHCAMYALRLKPGDEVIVPPITFAATANCVCYMGGKPVFADVEPDTLLMSPDEVEKKITSKTRAIITVDYAGQPCDYDKFQVLAKKYGLTLIADSCHALGAKYKGKKVGSLADLTVFSFHPVKHITTGEGGAIVTDNEELAERVKKFRNHGISFDFHHREKIGSWFYEIEELGYNYRITDIQCALGISQLKKLSKFLEKRREIAKQYDNSLKDIRGISPLVVKDNIFHAYHLYVVRVDPLLTGVDRKELFKKMRENGIGVNVHYIPVYLHPYYRKRFGYDFGLCPVAEAAYEEILSLPIFPEMKEIEVERVVSILKQSIFIK